MTQTFSTGTHHNWCAVKRKNFCALLLQSEVNEFLIDGVEDGGKSPCSVHHLEHLSYWCNPYESIKSFNHIKPYKVVHYNPPPTTGTFGMVQNAIKNSLYFKQYN
jgi:hypothetical protein